MTDETVAVGMVSIPGRTGRVNAATSSKRRAAMPDILPRGAIRARRAEAKRAEAKGRGPGATGKIA